MRLNQRNRNVIRYIAATLWLLGFMFIRVTSTTTGPLFPLRLGLALSSFFLVDYFYSIGIEILLTIIMKITYLDQMLDDTRALVIGAIWITASVSAGIKLLKPFNKPISPTPTCPTQELFVNFRHDLQTPINLILGFCKAILRTDEDQGQIIPQTVRENVQAIYRNAQQIDKMIGDFLDQVVPTRTVDDEDLDPTALIQECVALLQELMMAHGVKLELRVDDPLPKLKLHRITTRQTLLNILRSIVRANGTSENEAIVTVRAKVQHPALNITFTASKNRIQQARTDASWSQNERLLTTLGGRLWVQDAVGPNASANSDAILALPLPANRLADSRLLSQTNTDSYQNILVISEESNVREFFEDHLSKYKVIGIKDLHTLYDFALQSQPVALILTHEQTASQLQMISDIVGSEVPIIVCPVVTAQEYLDQLNVAYLPKPVDYDALFKILANAVIPVTEVLIVDDNLDSVEMLALMLTSMSPTFVIWKAYLAKDALALLNQNNITAIILDVSLPDMDGITLVQHIRSRERFVRVPIVLVSAQETLDAMLPITLANTLAVSKFGGFAPDNLDTYIEVLIVSNK